MWICNSCNLHNFQANDYCADYKCHKSRGFKLSRLEYWRAFYETFGVYLNMPAKDRGEELFKQFFNHENTLVSAMSFEELEKHIEELEDIAYEARVRLQAASGNRKNRVFQMSEEERDKLISQPDFTSSEKSKLDLPKRERRTKADRFLENIANLGLDEATTKALLANVKVDDKPAPKLVDKWKSKEETVVPTSNNTQEALLNEYITLTDPKDWKQACMNLEALGINGLMREAIERNCNEACDRLYERYRTIGHIAWKTKIMQAHLKEYNAETELKSWTTENQEQADGRMNRDEQVVNVVPTPTQESWNPFG
jgi:hypothetical protein